jgi:hypothetical protein
MFDDRDEKLIGPLSSTVWIENELRRLHTENEQWQARWVVLKKWVGKQRDDVDWTTFGIIENYMVELEKQHLHLPPQMPTIILGDESQ